MMEVTVSQNNKYYASENGVLFNIDKTLLMQYPGGKHGGYSILEGVIEIADGAFAGCDNLTNVVIPDSVTIIGDDSFSNCHGLYEIIVSEGNRSFMSDNGVLFNSAKDELISYPCGKSGYYFTIPVGVTDIRKGAFFGCINLTNVIIPDSVISIIRLYDSLGLSISESTATMSPGVQAATEAIAQVAEQATGSDESRTYYVGVSIYKFDDSGMTLYRQELEDYFKTQETNDVKYDVEIVDGKGDMAEQISQVAMFIAQGVDVLIINLVQPSSAATITYMVKVAGVPCVYINREPSADDMAAWDSICYVGSDARQVGTYQGEIIRDLPDHGDADGDGVVRYVMLIGDPENTDAQYRTEYSIKALTDTGIQVEELFAQRGDWEQAKGRELTDNALAQFGAKVDVVFANNDGMAMGAIQSIKSAGFVVGKDIYLVGVDAIPEALDAIRAGDMTGTVLRDHIGQSHAAADAAISYINGQSVEKYIWVNYQKVM